MDDPAKDYIKAVRMASDCRALIKAIEPYEIIASDALKHAKELKDNDFKDFVRDLKKASKSKDVTFIEGFNKRFGDIVLPRKMLTASLIAMQAHVPWGCAFNRGEQIGWDKI